MFCYVFSLEDLRIGDPGGHARAPWKVLARACQGPEFRNDSGWKLIGYGCIPTYSRFMIFHDISRFVHVQDLVAIALPA